MSLGVAPDEASAGPQPISGARRFPPFVWMATVAMFTLVLLGTLLLPQLRVPDEKHHADMVLMVQEGDWLSAGWPGLGERLLDPSIVAASLSLGRRERALRENRAAQHPPLFYLAAAATSSLTTGFSEDTDLKYRLWTFRLVSVIAAAALPLTCYLIACEVTSNRSVRLASAVVPLGIPGITLRDGPMINTDTLLILLTSLTILFAIRVSKGDLTVKTAILLGLSTGLAALTKGHALFVLPVNTVAYAIPVVRGGRLPKGWPPSIAISGGLSLAVGGWWWIRNLVLHGVVQPVRDLTPAAGAESLNPTEWLPEATERLIASFWGGGFALAGRPYLPLFIVLSILLGAAVAFGWIKSTDRAAAAVSGLFALILVPAVLVPSLMLSTERGSVVGVQGRYFFPALSGLAPLVAIAVAAIARRSIRWVPAFFVGGALVMSFLSVEYMLDRYWSSFGPRFADQWLAVLAASPFIATVSSAILVVAIVAFALLVGSAASIGLGGDSRSRRSPPEPAVVPVAITESEQSH